MPYPDPKNKSGALRHRMALLPERAILSAGSWDFTGFALSHAECGDEVVETRLDEESMMCWCLRCDVLRVFGTREADYPDARAVARTCARSNWSPGGR